MQRYVFQMVDKTGREAESFATGNVVAAAARAALINAGLPRAIGGLGMMQARIADCRLAAPEEES